jgi:type I restriction-modification system DNA methylase subunit
MSPTARETINEVDFCAKVAAAAEPIFAALRERCPFVEARVEGMGSTTGRMKRKDLRFYGVNRKLLLTGEVKLPGGVSAFDSELVQDAQQKADHAGVQFFFTWDVNTFVLWDRYQQNKPLLDRRIKVWPLRLNLASPQDVAQPEILDHVTRKFLPDLIADISDIVTGVRLDWSLPPDEVFLRSLESHLDWPVMLLRQYLYRNAEENPRFDTQLQKWLSDQGRPFLRNQPEDWRNAIDNAARTLAYVWTNRFIFYKALRARFPQLPKLDLAPSVKTPKQAIERLDLLFKKAAEESGDYETLLFPEKHDWANDEVFSPEGAVDAWRGFLRGIESVDFRDVPADVIGLIFQKLVSPEERHRLGQHFTGAEPVDLINSFCIRQADAVTLDPACGSGSFLVRAYYRKRTLTKRPDHAKLLEQLYGCDIALYPAHLATLNLAAREINDEANYPRIARENFFDIVPDREFCELPLGRDHERQAVLLPKFDAIVGNPPYVRQEKVTPIDKTKCATRIAEAFPGLQLTGRADLHCYFWPHATRYLKEGGYFGFLTSGQWLDVDYGFALQRWVLQNFRVVAIMESSTERWFADARVKTCITILERCSDAKRREENVVRFVRFEQPLADLFGVPATGGVGDDLDKAERNRQRAVDAIRDEIESMRKPVHDDRWRILLKRQGELWDEGVRAGAVLRDAPLDVDSEDEGADDEENGATDVNGQRRLLEAARAADYVAGKWGRFLRAPDLYFEVMRKYGDKFVPLGELVQIRRGITSGCDAFFMPRDVTGETLARIEDGRKFRELTGVSRSDVESGKVRIVKDGGGTIHAIEAEYVHPEVHSLMKVDRPVVRTRDLDRVVLMVPGPLSALRGTLAYKYVKYGERATYASRKSRAVPVPKRSTCAARDPWYDLTKLVDPGFAFWPMAQQYRHIIAANPDSLICNHNLFDMESDVLTKRQKQVLVGVLNSTLIGLFKTFYGRYAGTEGNLKTEVVDVNLIDVPDPRNVSPSVAEKIIGALKRMSKREVGRLLEESLMECRSYERAKELAARPLQLSLELQQPDRRELDDAVFELLGIESAVERRKLVDRLHRETAQHFRAIRVTEIQKMEDRRAGGVRRFAATEHAADIWDALDLTDVTPLPEWVRNHVGKESETIEIPDERPAYLNVGKMFDQDTVYFGKKRETHVVCPSRGTAEIVHHAANLGVSGSITVPSENAAAMKLLDKLQRRHAKAIARLHELVESRTADPEQQEEVLKVLERWFVLGRPKR